MKLSIKLKNKKIITISQRKNEVIMDDGEEKEEGRKKNKQQTNEVKKLKNIWRTFLKVTSKKANMNFKNINIVNEILNCVVCF